MTHKLKITNGAKILAASLLTVPEQFVTPAEVLRAAFLHESLTKDTPETPNQEYINQGIEFECTEAQRDLLKKSAEKNASRIPPSPHSVSLLTSLGFEQ